MSEQHEPIPDEADDQLEPVVDDEEGADDDVPTEPDEQPPSDPRAMSEREQEALFKRGDKEAERHAKRVLEIFGPVAGDFTPCPACLPFAPGFVYPPEIATPPDEIKQNVLAWLRLAGEGEYEKATDARACDTCKGRGRVLTGSLVPDQRTKQCSICKGYGWIPVGGPQPEQAQTTQNGQVDERQPLSEERETGADPWGRLPGDPDYGRLPQYTPAR